jgi:hypothetical protein
VPAGANEGDTAGAGGSGGGIFGQALIHGDLHGLDAESGRTGQKPHASARAASNPFSSIRTVTVGSGIAPDLLTPPPAGARGLMPARPHWSTPAITAGGDFHPAPRTPTQ